MTLLTELTETARTSFTDAIDQPYSYVRKELSEPDWRLPVLRPDRQSAGVRPGMVAEELRPSV